MSAYCYVLIFNNAVGTREEVVDFLDALPEITHWHAALPHSVFFTSSLSAGQIHQKIADKFGSDGGKRYIVLDTDSDRQGWLPKQAWHMMRNPNSPKLPDK